jgi:hypothetical protein
VAKAGIEYISPKVTYMLPSLTCRRLSMSLEQVLLVDRSLPRTESYLPGGRAAAHCTKPSKGQGSAWMTVKITSLDRSAFECLFSLTQGIPKVY